MNAREEARALEEARARIRRNFPKGTEGEQALRWDRDSNTAIISSCGTYRITKVITASQIAYWVWLCATAHAPARTIAGPYAQPWVARGAAQAHRNGEPMQAQLG